MSRDRALLATFVAALVAVAFARAWLASSTGIIAVGDAADYEGIAATLSLTGRVPFVYRPLVPLTVGVLFAGSVALGFAIVCAVAMFTALFATASLARQPLAGSLLAAVLFLDYQVLFAAAYPARLDIVVLAVQVGFVGLALAGRESRFVRLLPLCALLKESLLLGLVPLALLAFPRRRQLWARLAASSGLFIVLHLVVRGLAQPTAWMPPYSAGPPEAAALRAMAASNLSATAPLGFMVAWGGLCLVALYLALGGGSAGRDPLVPALVVFLLVFPIPLATDLHRAWFELLAPVVLFLILRRLRDPAKPAPTAALGLALVASAIPYGARLVAVEHLYLLILQERLAGIASFAVLLTLGFAAAALGAWLVSFERHPSADTRGCGGARSSERPAPRSAKPAAPS